MADGKSSGRYCNLKLTKARKVGAYPSLVRSYRAKDLLGLLQDGDLGPVVPLEHLDPRRVVHGGRRVRPEERGEALPGIESNFE